MYERRAMENEVELRRHIMVRCILCEMDLDEMLRQMVHKFIEIIFQDSDFSQVFGPSGIVLW